MRHSLRLPRIVLLVALAGFAPAGCSLFGARNPEAPLGPPLRVSYAEPDSTLDTMKRGVENRTVAGVEAYVGGLADAARDQRSFSAALDPEATARWQSTSSKDPPASWGLDREGNFIGYFVNRVVTKPCQMLWLPDEFHPHDEQPGPDEVLLHRRYVVTTPSGETSDTLAIGFADLPLEHVAADRWVITKWTDRVDPAIGVNPAKTTWLSFTARRLETY
jgi:hypothetical protein